ATAFARVNRSSTVITFAFTKRVSACFTRVLPIDPCSPPSSDLRSAPSSCARRGSSAAPSRSGGEVPFDDRRARPPQRPLAEHPPADVGSPDRAEEPGEPLEHHVGAGRAGELGHQLLRTSVLARGDRLEYAPVPRVVLGADAVLAGLDVAGRDVA